MNKIQQYIRCQECFKVNGCRRHTKRFEMEAPANCSGYLFIPQAERMIKEENKIVRDCDKEMRTHCKLSTSQTFCERTKKRGEIGFLFLNLAGQYQFSVLARALGSWKQTGGGGYFVWDMETGIYRKRASFYTLQEMREGK